MLFIFFLRNSLGTEGKNVTNINRELYGKQDKKREKKATEEYEKQETTLKKKRGRGGGGRKRSREENGGRKRTDALLHTRCSKWYK
jgi:hypothetical protein